MSITWQQELRILCDEVPQAAERIVRAIDNKTFDGMNARACAYGTAHEMLKASLFDVVEPLREARRRFAAGFGATPLEIVSFYHFNHSDIRAECVAWLAEHGSAAEASHVLSPA